MPVSRRGLWLGIAIIWLYWTSFFWLAWLFLLLNFRPPFHPWLVAALDALTWQPIIVVGTTVTRMLGYPSALLFADPLVGSVVGGVTTSVLWWAIHHVRARFRSRRLDCAAPEETS